MQTNRRTGRLLDLAGRQKVIEMGMRMEDVADGETPVAALPGEFAPARRRDR